MVAGSSNAARLISALSSIRTALFIGLVLAPWALPSLASARPESIRAGVSYYSDELVESGPVRYIGAEGNYEEVFQLYRYYEVLYDQNERVIRCLEYERGDVIRKDSYRCAADGSLLEHVTKPPSRAATLPPPPKSN